jgi:hypothetical protein
MKKCVWPLFTALALTGCVGGTITKLSESHPANPQAPPSPAPSAAPMLMAGSQGLVLPLSTNQTEMQHGHQQQPPAGKSAQHPAEHKHEHAPPKKQEEKE